MLDVKHEGHTALFLFQFPSLLYPFWIILRVLCVHSQERHSKEVLLRRCSHFVERNKKLDSDRLLFQLQSHQALPFRWCVCSTPWICDLCRACCGHNQRHYTEPASNVVFQDGTANHGKKRMVLILLFGCFPSSFSLLPRLLLLLCSE